ncbi:MAG: MtrB/PioB family outer membrane beta-barrel protein [Pseudoxanthomonas sp.]
MRHDFDKTFRQSPLAIALLLIGFSAQAQDSGLGTDLHFGNRLDPGAKAGSESCDPDGVTWLAGERKRTPTGFLYGCVPERDEGIHTASGWNSMGWLGLGYLYSGGDEGNALWNRFSGFDDGPLLQFSLGMQRPEDGSYFDLYGNRINEHSQYYRFVGGRAGKYRVQAFARSQTNILSSSIRSVWDNVGSQHLTLKPELVPGASTAAQVDAVMAGNPETSVRVTRTKQGVGLNYFLNPRWTAFANASHEKREGARPFGGAFSFGRLIESLRPIDDSTVNVNGGARFVGKLWRMEYTYTGSFFRNGMSHFTYEMPLTTTNNNPVGLFSYEPENDYHRIGTTLTRKIKSEWNGELSLTASFTHMRQNDQLVPGLFACKSGMLNATISCDNWNTSASLSRSRAGLGIDNTRIGGRLTLQPTNNLTWRTTFSGLREDYDGNYLAYNPLTGQYGYIGENGAFPNTVWVPGGSNMVHVRNLPLDKETKEISTGLDWRISRANTLGATYTFTRIDRTHRELESTDDNGIKLTWFNRSLDWFTFRANYSYLDRRGGNYESDPYEFMYSEELPGFVMPAAGLAPHTVDAMRKYDVGERKQQKIDFMGTFTLPHQMTIYASVRGERNDYDTLIGRRGYRTSAASVQWEWQPATQTTLSAWLGKDTSRLDTSNTNDVPAGRDDSLGGVAPANGGNAAYPNGYRYWMFDKQRNLTAGFNLQQSIRRVTFNLDWNYLDARGITGWDAESVSAGNGTSAGLTGTFPDLTYRINSVTASIQIPLRSRVGLRLFGTRESGDANDWHYAGFDADRTYGNMIYIDGGPQSYHAYLVGALLEFRL